MGLLEATLGGLGYAGDAVDKLGGRATRGVLGGHPQEVASIVPFSDSLGLTNYKDRVSGRDLTDKWGITSKGNNALSQHLLGAGAEIALDPLNVAGAGFLAGRAANRLHEAGEAGGMLADADKVGDATKGAVGRFLADESGAVPITELHGKAQHSLRDEIAERFGGNKIKAWAALNQGPRYPGGIDKLKDIVANADDPAEAGKSLSSILSDPHAAERLASELPEDSSFLGAGAEGGAFMTPWKSVVRVSREPGDPVARLAIPEMVQPYRSVIRGGRTIEHLPHATPLEQIADGKGDALNRALQFADPTNPEHVAAMERLYVDTYGGLGGSLEQAQMRIIQGLERRGFDPWDWHDGNVAHTNEGNLAAIDPGAISVAGAQDNEAVLNVLRRAAEPGGANSWLLGPPKPTPPGGWNLSQKMRPDLYHWPVGSIPNTPAQPKFNSLVKHEAEKLGIPSLIQDDLLFGAEKGTAGMGAPAPEVAQHAGTLDLIERAKSLFGGDRGDGRDLDRFVSHMLGSHMANPGQGETAAEALRRIQANPDSVHFSLQRWLEGKLPSLRNLASGEGGYLRHSIPGVEPELANAMDGLGPQFPGGPGKFDEIANGITSPSAQFSPSQLQDRIRMFGRGPDAERLAGEVPQGSQFLGAGMEGVAFRTPDGSVIRLGEAGPHEAVRPDIPEMLQPLRETLIGGTKVEHLPMVNPVHEQFGPRLMQAGRRNGSNAGHYSDQGIDALNANDRLNDNVVNMSHQMRYNLDAKGYDPWDVSPWNTSLTNEGKAIIHDGGAIREHPFVGEPGVPTVPPRPVFDAPQGDLLQRVLAADGPAKVRESLRQGLAAGTRGQGVDLPQLAEIIQNRRKVQEYLASQGIDPGVAIDMGIDPALERTPAYDTLAGAGRAPTPGMLLGATGGSLAGGGLLAYLMSRQGNNW